MLAYNVACLQQDVSGLIVSNLLDNRDEKYGYIRLKQIPGEIRNKAGRFIAFFLRRFKIPIKMVTNMNALVNDKEVLEVLLKDKRGAGSSVSLEF